MEYCSDCGKELADGVTKCPECGCPIEEAIEHNFTLKKIVFAFMLVGIVTAIGVGICFAVIIHKASSGSMFAFIMAFGPLIWGIPMTVYYWKMVKNHIKISTTFKVCTLVFVCFVSGILMLRDKKL